MPSHRDSSPAAALRVLVDLTHLHPAGISGGIKPALFAMLRWLGRQAIHPVEFVFVVNTATAAEVVPLVRPVDRVVAQADAGFCVAAAENCDLVYGPFGIADYSCPGIPTLTLIVDVLHRDFPGTLSDEEIRVREARMAVALQRTDLFQVISDFTGSQLQRHFGVPAEKIIRTYLPLPVPPSPEGESLRREQLFLYPANGWKHKNHETLLEAYALYAARAGSEAWPLVLCGHLGARAEFLQNLTRQLGIAHQVRFLGYLSDVELNLWWWRAAALVFPSLHEGFGIPLWEAMARGIPVLAGQETAIPEVIGDAALLVNARSPQALADGLWTMASDATLRQRLAILGRKRAGDFSAESEFHRLLDGMVACSQAPARFRSLGYHEEDGLVEQEAAFALPDSGMDRVLRYEIAPLGIARTLEILAGGQLLARIQVPADSILTDCLSLPVTANILRLCIPNASKLSPSDPRTHGVLLRKLQVEKSGAPPTDLLTSTR